MRISWVLANQTHLDPTVDISQLKDIGSIWGGWQTWRSYQTDNVICYDPTKAAELLKRNFQQKCNFYLPNNQYQFLGRPEGVRLFEGEIKHEVDNVDDLVSLNLASTVSDVIAILGFNLEELEETPDRLAHHKKFNYQNLIYRTIEDNPEVQWVIVDHPGPLAKIFGKLTNLTQDTLDNILG